MTKEGASRVLKNFTRRKQSELLRKGLSYFLLACEYADNRHCVALQMTLEIGPYKSIPIQRTTRLRPMGRTCENFQKFMVHHTCSRRCTVLKFGFERSSEMLKPSGTHQCAQHQFKVHVTLPGFDAGKCNWQSSNMDDSLWAQLAWVLTSCLMMMAQPAL